MSRSIDWNPDSRQGPIQKNGFDHSRSHFALASGLSGLVFHAKRLVLASVVPSNLMAQSVILGVVSRKHGFCFIGVKSRRPFLGTDCALWRKAERIEK